MSIKDLSPQEKVKILGKYIWHHSIDFGDGVVSPGGCSLEVTNNMASALFGNIDLSNRSVLDIGAWNGAYSFAAKRRGAIRVTASDCFCWKHEQFKGRETFDLARDLNGLDVEALEVDVPEITPVSAGYHDVVLFSGVFYHLVAPVHSLLRLSRCATKLLILETHHDLLDSDSPGMIFYPGAELNNDPTNWWGPNPRCVYDLLKLCGFHEIFYQDSPGYGDPRSDIFRTRGIYHAFRDSKNVGTMTLQQLAAPWNCLEDADKRAEIFKPVRAKK